jgi:hypothetical protein
MTTAITQVANTTSIRSAEFVRLTITTTATSQVYTFSSSYRNELIYFDTNNVPTLPANRGGGVYTSSTFSCLGGLMQVGEQHRDLRVTSFDTNVVITGLDPGGYDSHGDPGGANTTGSNIYRVLSSPIRGSIIEIYRGFYDNNYNLVNFVQRFRGVVTGYQITEEIQDGMDMFSVALNCSSYKRILENNIGGRRTNNNEWTNFYAGADTSMSNIEALSGTEFNFGKTV